MGEIVKRSRNIFIDTEQYHSNGDLVRLFFPNEAFALNKDESMKFVLSSFEMQKKFYNVNAYNNTFYAIDPSDDVFNVTKIQISEGDYFQFGANAVIPNSLCEAIYNALGVAGIEPSGATVTEQKHKVTYDINTRKLSIDMSNVAVSNKWGSDSYFATFQVPPSRQAKDPSFNDPSGGLDSLGFFNDSYEILGTRPTKYSGQNNLIQAFDISDQKFTSFYPASLYTIESIHLATSLQNNNYQTPNLDADSQASRLIPTQIFARIPLDMGNMFGTTQDSPSIIKFEDTGAQLFSMDLQRNTIDTFNFRIIDAKGREITEVSKGQYTNGALSYKMVLKYEVLHTPEVGRHAGFLANHHQLEANQENKFIRNAF